MTRKSIFIVAVVLSTLSACRYDPLDVDTTDVRISVGFVNLDSLLWNSDSSALIGVYHEMKTSIPELFDYQVGYCMGIGKVSDTAFVNSVLTYREDAMIQQLEQEIAGKFDRLDTYKKELKSGFTYLKAHLPSAPIPKKIVFQNSLFTSSAFSTETEIGIGLERYLGVNSTMVKQLPAEPFYEWIKEGFDARYLSRDVLASWIMTNIVAEEEGNLAQQIIRYGKVLYLTQAAFPTSDEATILRYSKEDLQWAMDNEYAFWKYLIDQDMLFKTDERNAANMLTEGPFTPGLPEKGPDRLGQFLGWRMVKNYMETTEASFEELLNIPYNEILQSYEVEE